MFDRPFKELHELYRIVYLRAMAQAKIEEDRKAQEAKNNKNKAPHRKLPPDAQTTNSFNAPSPMEAEALEDAFEEMMEGGV